MLFKLLILQVLLISNYAFAKNKFFSFMDDFSETVQQAMPDGMKFGVSLLTTESDSSGETTVKGVLFMNYDGYKYELDSTHSELYLVPTNVFVDVEGKQVMAYTDLGTLQYYGESNIEYQISAVSINYEKLDSFTVNTDQTIAIADFNVIKKFETNFFSLGVIQFDISLGATVGGTSKQDIILNAEEDYQFSDAHFYTVDSIIGTNIPLTDKVDLYIYGQYAFQKNENSELEKVSAGVHVYGVTLGNEIEVLPYVEFVEKNYVSKDSGLEEMLTSEDSMLMFGIRFYF